MSRFWVLWVIILKILIKANGAAAIIQKVDCLQDLVHCVTVQDLVGHNLEELFKANGAAASFVIIQEEECLQDLILCAPVQDFAGQSLSVVIIINIITPPRPWWPSP